jgi:fumarylacetoacetase
LGRIDHTHDPSLQSWVESANRTGSDFPIQNLPFGVFLGDDRQGRIGVAIGDQILDVSKAIEAGLLGDLSGEAACALSATTLNSLMSQGQSVWRQVRSVLSNFLSKTKQPNPECLVPMAGATMIMPVDIGDYTDFYASRHHATNLGKMFRPDGDALLPNYLHLPVGYHGRASSVVISGTSIQRPQGQLKPEEGPPVFGPCRLLDYELEFAAFVGEGNPIGTRVEMDQAMDRLFGLVILNDWSARDIQKWEYQPLGPFNGKNFASSISPWVVTMDALAPYRSSEPARLPNDPEMLSYLRPINDDALEVTGQVSLVSQQMREQGLEAVELSRGSLGELTWTFAQMLTHHTSSGCPMRPGDLLGSGTVSGATKDTWGSMLELAWRGTDPIDLPDGTQRKLLQDGDEVIMKAWCESEGAARIGFGSCCGVITPVI